MSRSSRVSRSSLRSWASSARSAVVRPSARAPSSMSACLTHARTAVSVRPISRATPPAVLPGWRTSATTSALNSGVNDRRRRGFLPAIVSIVDILSGASRLMVDVRQTGSGPEITHVRIRHDGQVDSDRTDELTHLYERFLPTLQAAPGSRAVYILIDRSTGDGHVIGLWETADDAQAFETTGTFGSLLAECPPGLVTGRPARRIAEVLFQASATRRR
jgi:hypothetical protein